MFSLRSFFTLALSAAALFMPARFAAAQDGPRIATVNPAKVFNDMKETKDLKQKMESDRTAIQNEGKRRADDLEEAKKKLTIFNEGSEEYNKASKDVIEKAVGLQTWQELIKADLA